MKIRRIKTESISILRKNIWIIVLLFFVNNLFSQSNIESKLQSIIDFIYEADSEAVEIMVHVKTPEKGLYRLFYADENKN